MYSSLNIYNQPVTLAPTTVASPNAAYQRMANFWGLIEDLKEGTYKIRSEHRKYLQKNQERLMMLTIRGWQDQLLFLICKE